MAIVALDEIKKAGKDFNEDLKTKLLDVIDQPNDEASDDVVVSLNAVLSSTVGTLDDNLQVRVKDLNDNLQDRVKDLDDNLSALLVDPEEQKPSLQSVLSDTMKTLDGNLQDRVKDLDENLNTTVGQFDSKLLARVADFNTAIEQRIDQVRDEIMNPGFDRLQTVLDDLKRKFVRATLLLLYLAGILVLILTLQTAAPDSDGLRAVLYVIFIMMTLPIFFSNTLLNKILRIEAQQEDADAP